MKQPDEKMDDDNERRAARVVSGVNLRRAVMRILLREEGPIELAELVRRLEVDERLDLVSGRTTDPHHRISDLLGWQVRCGRVHRVRPGWYEAVPDAISRTNRWRIENWERWCRPCTVLDELLLDDRTPRPSAAALCSLIGRNGVGR